MKYTLKNDDDFSWYVVLGECVLFFLAFFCLWLELVVEFVRFQNMPGPFDDMMRFIFLFGIVLMATNCEQRQYLSANIKGFTFFFLVSLSSIFGLHVAYLYNGINDAIRYCRWRAMIYGMVIVSTGTSLLLSLYFVEYYLNVGLLTLNVLIILFYSLNSFRVTEESECREKRRKEAEIKAEEMDKELDEPIEAHFLERFGLFVMITAGESILALVISYAEYDQTPQTYSLIYVAFTMVFLIKMTYFANNVNVEEGHALHKNKSPGAVAFCALHFFLCLFLLWLGTAWKLVFYKWKGEGTIGRIYVIYMGAAVVGTMVSLILCRFTHTKYVCRTLSWLRLIPIGAVMVICFYFREPIYCSMGCVGCFLVLYYVDYKFYNSRYNDEGEEEHHGYEDTEDKCLKDIEGSKPSDYKHDI
jgi:low temperature requirement protein LtrA